MKYFLVSTSHMPCVDQSYALCRPVICIVSTSHMHCVYQSYALCRSVISIFFSLGAASNCVLRSRRLTFSIHVTLICGPSQTGVVCLIPTVLLMKAFCLFVFCLFGFFFACFVFLNSLGVFLVGVTHSGETLIPSHGNLYCFI